MTARALLKGAGALFGQHWPVLLASTIVSVSMLVFVVWPLEADVRRLGGQLKTAKAELSEERRRHLASRAELSAEQDARADAAARVVELGIENAALARDLDRAQRVAQTARQEAASQAERTINETDPDWSSVSVPGAVAIELCLGLAAIAGAGDGVHYADCGGSAGDDGRPGAGAGDVPGHARRQ